MNIFERIFDFFKEKEIDDKSWVVEYWDYGRFPGYLNVDDQQTHRNPRNATLMTYSTAKATYDVMSRLVTQTGDKVEIVRYKDALRKYSSK